MMLGMRFTFLFSLVAVSIFGTAYWYVSTAGICPAPVYYRLGEVDSRFGISETEAREALVEAEALWEEALGSNLFEYKETTNFTVNFKYDERQIEAVTEESWRISLDDKETKTKKTFAAIEALQAEYEIKRKEYTASRERYESRLDSYNNKVEDINTGGGARAEEFRALEAEKTTLSSELKTLLSLEAALNRAGEELNKKGEAANAEVESYNAEVVRYNQVYGERSEIFTQGDYERKGINIYTFSTKSELRTVLAHEFGHALGIGHVEGSESLMYYLMADQPNELSLSAEDLTSLTTICGDEERLTSTIRRTIRTALTYL